MSLSLYHFCKKKVGKLLQVLRKEKAMTKGSAFQDGLGFLQAFTDLTVTALSNLPLTVNFPSSYSTRVTLPFEERQIEIWFSFDQADQGLNGPTMADHQGITSSPFSSTSLAMDSKPSRFDFSKLPKVQPNSLYLLPFQMPLAKSSKGQCLIVFYI